MPDTTRRAFLAATALSALPARAATHPVRLGGPIFLKTDDPAALAREHRRLGYRAAYCPNVKPDDAAAVRAVKAAFAAENVIIAEVGAWKNLLDPDPARRKDNIAFVVQRLALAEAVSARCCVDIAGSFNPKVWYGPHPGNLSREFFDATVENVRRIVDEIKPRRTKFTLEMMGWALPDGPDSCLELIKAIDRKAFGVHLDVCNGINSPARYYRNADYIAECFRKLGPWIASCHAKDLEWKIEQNVHFAEVVPGRGGVDYRAYLRELARLPADVPLMLEHLTTAEEFAEGAAYIRKMATEEGVQLA